MGLGCGWNDLLVALDPKRTRMDKQRPHIHIAGIAKRIDLFVWSPGNWPGSDLGKWNAIEGFVLAMQVLPSVIFFSVVISLSYYLNIIQTCVNGFARFFNKSMALSGAESFSASASIFFGIESSLLSATILTECHAQNC